MTQEETIARELARLHFDRREWCGHGKRSRHDQPSAHPKIRGHPGVAGDQAVAPRSLNDFSLCLLLRKRSLLR